MFLLSGTLNLKEVDRDQFRRVLARYFSSRKWKVEENEIGLVVRVGTAADHLFRGYVFFCKQVEFDLSGPDRVVYHFRPNWLVIGFATIMVCLIGAIVVGSQHSGQEALRAVLCLAVFFPVYPLFMVGQLKSVVLRDLKVVASKE